MVRRSYQIALLEHIHGRSIRDLIVAALETNRSVRAAARSLGVDYWTFRRWMQSMDIKVEKAVVA